jgi:hypothetical protein
MVRVSHRHRLLDFEDEYMMEDQNQSINRCQKKKEKHVLPDGPIQAVSRWGWMVVLTRFNTTTRLGRRPSLTDEAAAKLADTGWYETFSRDNATSAGPRAVPSLLALPFMVVVVVVVLHMQE